jgi:quinoprotein glucose dehydrogenase
MKRTKFICLLLVAFISASAVGSAFFVRNQKDQWRNRLERSFLGPLLFKIYHVIIPNPTDINKITYSIFSQQIPSDLRNYKSRASMPEFKVIKGLDAGALSRLRSVPSIRFDRWERSGADAYSSKYSELDQINRDNVKHLQLAWIYHSNGSWHGNVETNPIIAGTSLFVATPDDFLVSINAKTGVENWRTPIHTPARRGLLWWAGNAAHAPRLFVPSSDGVYALNPDNGTLIESFGIGGRVGGAASLVPPAVDGDRLIIATVAPSVEAYIVETGALLWRTSLLGPPPPQVDIHSFRQGGGLPWGGFSLDSARSRIYVSTGNPTPILYGADRPGPNNYSCSVIAIDTATGEIKWSFQEIGHDLWDFDIPAPPILVKVKKDNISIDAVAVVTKVGNTLLLDRDNGKPIFDLRFRRAPVSTVPGEQTWDYQPDLEIPEPFFTPTFSPSDITNIGESESAHAQTILRNSQFGFFVPPAINGKIVTFGEHGGAEWPGAAVDQKTGILYVPSNRDPWILRLIYAERAPNPVRASDKVGDSLYQDKCAACHGVRREGYYDRETIIAGDPRPAGDTANPSLIGITASRNIKGVAWFRKSHSFVELPKEVTDEEIEIADRYLSAADRFSDDRKSLEVSYVWSPVLDGKGHPGSKPPWGMITAIDLNTGKRIWTVPFGEYADLRERGIPITGQPNFGGVIVTKGGLVFATGTIDQKVRAFDSSSGAQLWESDLPAAGTAPPATYEIDGVQYLVVVATGGIFAGFHGNADTIIAFKLRPAESSAKKN